MIGNSEELWINNEVFSWNLYRTTSSKINTSDKVRAHELYHRADELLVSEGASAFGRSDAISNLNRAIRHRLENLEKHYFLKNIILKNAPKGYLELLEKYGIVRPTMLRTLIQIRNSIEHGDKQPPSLERCLELSDLTWYFLKSTDAFLVYLTNGVCFQAADIQYESVYGFDLQINYENNHEMKLSGSLPSSLLSSINTDGHTLLRASKYKKRQEPNIIIKPKTNQQSRDDVVDLVGSIHPDNESKFAILSSIMTSDY